MKKLFSFLLLTMLAGSLHAQKSAVLNIFERYSNMEGITSVKVSKSMFTLLKKFNFDDEDLNELKPLLDNVNSLQLIITEMPDSADAAKSKVALADMKLNMLGLQSQINNAVEGLKYAELITVNTKGQKIRLLTNETNNDVLDNLLFSFTSPTQQILMLLDGRIPLSLANKYIENISN